MFITIGDTHLYSEGILSTYDGSTLSDYDAMTLVEVFPLSDSELLGCEQATLNHDIGGRSTASFVIRDSTGANTFTERQQVVILDEDQAIAFGGIVASCQEIRIPGTDYVFHSIDAADYTAICDWRIVDYAAEDKLAGDAVSEILAEYLEEEGITEGYIEDGNLLTEISIGNKSVTEAFNKLAEACNFIWYIDYDRMLYFYARTLYASNWSISDYEDILSESFLITRQNPAYRNTEIVVGGYEETSEQTESFVCDGTVKTFPLGYPVNRVTSVTHSTAGVQSVGRKGTDAGSYDCYYDIQSETLTFDTAPVEGTGTIVYYGLWQSKAKAEDLSAITDNATRQGFGSGKIEHVTTDTNLTSITAAGEYANAKLSQYAKNGISISYKTLREGIESGTLQHIAVAGIDDDFLITHVTETYKDTIIEYQVDAVSGPVDDSWESWFHQELLANTQQIREGVEENGVTKLYSFSHTYADADRPNPFTAAAIGTGLLVSDDTWPCFEKEDRAEYIEFWYDGAATFRKQHTSVPDETASGEFNAYSFIAPAEGTGDIDHIAWIGGDSATATIGTGVEMRREDFAKVKSILESYQINFESLEG